jgi:hypothetical protein
LASLESLAESLSTRHSQIAWLIFDLSNHTPVCPLVSYDYLIPTISFPSLHSAFSAEDLEDYICFARSYEEVQSTVDKDATISPTITASTFSSLGFGSNAASSATSYTPDPHAVSKAEAQSYCAGLPSEPTLLYRTGKEQWSLLRGPEARRRLKELCEVFTHPIAKVWNRDLGWQVVKVMDAHTVSQYPSYRRVC